ncbi:RelA/SpoT family protein [Endothiovibrio diazotrophicus]
MSNDTPLARLLEGRNDQERERISAAWTLAEQCGALEPEAAADSCTTLTTLEADAATHAAALLLPAVESGLLDLPTLHEKCDGEVAALAEGAARMQLIEALHEKEGSRLGSGTEGLRKMLLAMIEDVRVVFVKLAQRLTLTRRAKHGDPAERERIARENLDIFAPLANRLGIWQLKWELEDLSLHALEPDEYQRIARLLEEKRGERETFIHQVIEELRAALAAVGVHGDIAGRPKHIYSIWKKMKRKRVDFHQVFDVRAVRVLVDDIAQCYTVLGIVHGRWSPVAGEFDDYVANPKENGYRSLHTAVYGPEGKPFEVQIRTCEMHRESELGIAAHWRYKEGGGGRDQGLENKLLWLRQLMSWKGEGEEAEGFVEHFKSEVFDERVYVFSPRGQVVDLAAGATPLDFAYHIHTEVGHRCRGAKVNGRITPLNTPLETGDRVEILTAKEGEPSRDWLNPHLHYLATSRAREKVRSWFRALDYDKNVAAGRTVLERELHRQGLKVEQERIARRSRFPKLDDFLAALGRGDINSTQLSALLQEFAPRPEPALPTVDEHKARKFQRRPGAVEIQGVGNLLTQIAQCCRPAPGDPIVGYITHGAGVTIHRADCNNALHLASEQPERMIEVSWSDGGGDTYPVEIQVTAFDRQGLLRDVTGVFSDLKLNVLAVNTRTDESDYTAHMTFTVAVNDIAELGRVLDRIGALPNVREARRKV